MKAYFILIIAIFTSVAVIAQESWELKKDDEGIRVYTRRIEGSNFKEYRAVAEVDTDIPSIVALLKDIATYPEWISNTASATLLDSNQHMLKYHLKTDIPNFLVRDRDLVNVLEFQYEDVSRLKINMWSEPELVPIENDYVRIDKSNGHWLLQNNGDGRVTVTLQVHTEPNGSIPSWMVNAFVVDAPFEDLKSLRERVKLEKYSKMSITSGSGSN